MRNYCQYWQRQALRCHWDNCHDPIDQMARGSCGATHSEVGKAQKRRKEEEENVERKLLGGIVDRGNQLLWDGEQLCCQRGLWHGDLDRFGM